MSNISRVYLCKNCKLPFQSSLQANECCPDILSWQCDVCKRVYFNKSFAERCFSDHNITTVLNPLERK